MAASMHVTLGPRVAGATSNACGQQQNCLGSAACNEHLAPLDAAMRTQLAILMTA